jgi:hypothetical protein
VSADGVRVDPKDVEAVQALKEKTPRTVGDVRRLLGFLSYYRTYVQDFSRIARPLYELLQIKKSPPEPKPARGKPQGPQLHSRTPVKWNSEHQQILERLINILTNPPVLGYPDFNQPFILHTDASQQGLGAVLYQNQDGKMRVRWMGKREREREREREGCENERGRARVKTNEGHRKSTGWGEGGDIDRYSMQSQGIPERDIETQTLPYVMIRFD